MGDKTGEDGSSSGIGCTDSCTCFSVYHSCTVPLLILGLTPRIEMLSSGQSQSSDLVDWPTEFTEDGGSVVDIDIKNVYRRESCFFSPETFTLTTAPARYCDNVGGLYSNPEPSDSASTTSKIGMRDD
mmetsp:Transcript_12742/g.15524  ORF Transcript_12742/g.15524 Transcript_12742/m.15524 type:complete len:128 (-) Transcript_12742:181-564(-)